MAHRVFLLTVVLLLAACGPGRIEKPNNDLPTLLEIDYFDTGTKTINIRLYHRQADVRATSKLECQLRINDGDYQPLSPLQVPELTAYARERLQWIVADSHILPSQDRIDYTLDCSLKSNKSRDEYFISRGTLYRLGNQEPPIYR